MVFPEQISRNSQNGGGTSTLGERGREPAKRSRCREPAIAPLLNQDQKGTHYSQGAVPVVRSVGLSRVDKGKKRKARNKSESPAYDAPCYSGDSPGEHCPNEHEH